MLGDLRSKEKVQGSGQGEVVEQMAQGKAVGLPGSIKGPT